MKVLIKDGKKTEEACDALKQIPEFKSIEADVLRYSITPTTFETRQYEKDLDCWYHVDHYHTASEATRFGLNDKSSALQAVIKSECKTFDASSARPPSTVRSTKYLPEDARKIALCSSEQDLINMAVEHLVKYGERAVVVDILERMNGGRENGFVKFENGIPKIHSVVLYMNPTQAAAQAVGAAAAATPVLSVIDPSNLLFSVHLSNFKPQVNGTTYEMRTFHKSVQIYKPYAPKGQLPDIGEKSHQFRDCIDIAVKLAMNLNASSTHHDLSDINASLATCPIIQNISNQSQFDGGIIEPKLPVRVKQTSDVSMVEKFCEVQRKTKQNLEEILSLFEQGTYKAVAQKTNTILENSLQKKPIDVIVDLCYHDRVCTVHIDSFKDAVAAENQKLLGDI